MFDDSVILAVITGKPQTPWALTSREQRRAIKRKVARFERPASPAVEGSLRDSSARQAAAYQLQRCRNASKHLAVVRAKACAVAGISTVSRRMGENLQAQRAVGEHDVAAALEWVAAEIDVLDELAAAVAADDRAGVRQVGRLPDLEDTLAALRRRTEDLRKLGDELGGPGAVADLAAKRHAQAAARIVCRECGEAMTRPSDDGLCGFCQAEVNEPALAT
jgi:hypothetical protein